MTERVITLCLSQRQRWGAHPTFCLDNSTMSVPNLRPSTHLWLFVPSWIDQYLCPCWAKSQVPELRQRCVDWLNQDLHRRLTCQRGKSCRLCELWLTMLNTQPAVRPPERRRGPFERYIRLSCKLLWMRINKMDSEHLQIKVSKAWRRIRFSFRKSLLIIY